MECGLFHLMEDFILKEIDYAQEHGYSSRAKRYMRKRLNQELAPYINDSDEEESIILPQSANLNILISIGYIFVFGVFYSTSMYIVHTYSKNCP
jgi:hypothetical protein